MHFGLPKKSRWVIHFLLLCTVISSCKNEQKVLLNFSSPNQGDAFFLGENVNIKLDVPENVKIDTAVYLIDGKQFATGLGANAVTLPTANLPLGYRMISAVLSYDEHKDTINTNIVLKSKLQPKQLTYRVVNTFPHDTSAYTEGLSFVDGKFLESTGEKGASQLKWVDLKTGMAIQKTTLPDQYFGEGSVKVADKIIMLTWQEGIGFIFDAKSLKQLGTFPYGLSKEGWGLTFDGKNILRSDGSNRIWTMNATTFKEEGYIEVYDKNGAVDSINELEFIDGKIYANVYQTDKIIVINPANGVVEAQLDLSALVPKNYFKTKDEIDNNVLNGIAWDAVGKRLFVTGKKWPKLYEIKLQN